LIRDLKTIGDRLTSRKKPKKTKKKGRRFKRGRWSQTGEKPEGRRRRRRRNREKEKEKKRKAETIRNRPIRNVPFPKEEKKKKPPKGESHWDPSLSLPSFDLHP